MICNIVSCNLDYYYHSCDASCNLGSSSQTLPVPFWLERGSGTGTIQYKVQQVVPEHTHTDLGGNQLSLVG